MTERKTQIVVVGGGAGGLELAPKLGARFGRKHYDIILVEKNRTHIWKPLLHEVAAGSLDANLDEVGYRSHGHPWGYRFFLGTMEGIDRDSRQVMIAPILDEDGREIMGRTASATIIWCWRSARSATISAPRAWRSIASSSTAAAGRPLPLQAAQPLPARVAHDAGRSRGGRPCADRHRRRRRDRRRAGGRALQCRRGAAPLRAGSVRREPARSDPDRGGAAHPAGAARAAGRGRARGAGSAGRPRPDRRAGDRSHRRRRSLTQVGRADRGRSASLGGGVKGADIRPGLDGLELSAQQPAGGQADAADHPRRRASSPSAIAACFVPEGSDQAGAAARAGRAPDGVGRVREPRPADREAGRCGRSSTRITARWSRSATSPPWAA